MKAAIEQLLDKYFKGESSLEEELYIREYFRQEVIPAHLKPLKVMFLQLQNEASRQSPDVLLEKLDHQLVQAEHSQKRIKNLKPLTWIGLAAGILLVAGLFRILNPVTHKMEDTFNDPEKALQQTQKVLLFVSAKLNNGLQPAANVGGKLEKGLEATAEFGKLTQSVQRIENADPLKIYLNQITP